MGRYGPSLLPLYDNNDFVTELNFDPLYHTAKPVLTLGCGEVQCLYVGCQARLLVLKTPEFFDGCQEMNFFFF